MGSGGGGVREGMPSELAREGGREGERVLEERRGCVGGGGG